MNKVKFKLNGAGVREILKSDAAKSMCEEKARSIASACGSGYASNSYTGANRVNGMAYAESFEARKDNAKNNTLLKAMK
ncbi:MAG: hypothetical protein E7189_06525 [Erysipelotrichaceae bacterium]|nr:hypothetical protein [Erysipelotrichaceae bacterium]